MWSACCLKGRADSKYKIREVAGGGQWYRSLEENWSEELSVDGIVSLKDPPSFIPFNRT